MKCDVKTCKAEGQVFRSKKNNPKLKRDIIFCEAHAQVGRLIGAVLSRDSKQEIQKRLDKLVEINRKL